MHLRQLGADAAHGSAVTMAWRACVGLVECLPCGGGVKGSNIDELNRSRRTPLAFWTAGVKCSKKGLWQLRAVGYTHSL